MVSAKTKLRKLSNGRPLRQIAALPYRRDESGNIEVLIVSSRETRRAVIPKGWPMKGLKDWKAAQVEARQEAGVIGTIGRKKCGEFVYWKRLDSVFGLVKVAVYPLLVRRQLADWPERHERVQRWLSPDDAALLVDEPDLASVILDATAALAGGTPAGGKGDRPVMSGNAARRARAPTSMTLSRPPGPAETSDIVMMLRWAGATPADP
ncbi:NUDIX hydrolase [Ancylobacter lacus]|uniref:NUDIX hydrolase n=1 Tax=Ancylobacter lacus TaxID=2579970 RepID=UPI001FE350A2|nr:NUDIX hydrolase [Ancylobacter lacus]